MILQTKLNKVAYKTADPSAWLGPGWELLDPVFAGRLAYYCMVKALKAIFNRGYATPEEQAKLYAEFLAGKRVSAAKPGTSWHEFRLAVDITFCSDGKTRHPIRNATNAELAPYGLCKPIASEGWHIQPIETGKPGLSRTAFAPVDLAPQLKAKFKLTDAEAGYIAAYKYAVDLAVGLLAGKKDFSAGTTKYLYSWKGWETLRTKLGL